jgi:membrane carboxypeptidase/penicillin-binding protein PbpC
MNELYKNRIPAIFKKPKNIEYRKICSISGMKPNPFCKTTSLELFKKSSEVLDICTYHTKNNIFHNIGGEYSSWDYDRNIKNSTDNFKIDSENNGGTSGFLITYPHNNDRFIIEEDGKNIIHMKVEIGSNVQFIRWFIDGKEVGKSISPYYFNWKLKRGKHKISAATPDNQLSTITIFVQ